jgi:hypothetical protein
MISATLCALCVKSVFTQRNAENAERLEVN